MLALALVLLPPDRLDLEAEIDSLPDALAHVLDQLGQADDRIGKLDEQIRRADSPRAQPHLRRERLDLAIRHARLSKQAVELDDRISARERIADRLPQTEAPRGALRFLLVPPPASPAGTP